MNDNSKNDVTDRNGSDDNPAEIQGSNAEDVSADGESLTNGTGSPAAPPGNGPDKKTNNERSRVGKIIRTAILLACIGVFVYSGYGLIVDMMESNQSEALKQETLDLYEEEGGAVTMEELDELLEALSNYESATEEPVETATPGSSLAPEQTVLPDQSVEPTPDPTPTPTPKPRLTLEQILEKNRERFAKLLEKNSDFIGYLIIPNTDIVYPVVHTTDNEFYLHNDFDKNKSSRGCIFMDYRNQLDPLDTNTILYGHHMRNGSMFGRLGDYKNQSFYKNAKYVYIDTIYGISKWEIFNVFVTTDTDATSSPNAPEPLYYINTYFTSAETYQSFLDESLRRGRYKTGVEVTTDDYILTLSTCDYTYKEGRFVVQCKLLQSSIKAS